MDDLDRLYRRLLTVIRTTRPEYAQIPFTVQELVEQLVPYRHHRRELGIDTNQEYEIAVARLLAGERDYVQTEPSLQEAVRTALASPTDDPGIYREYAHALVQLTGQGTANGAIAHEAAMPSIPAAPADHTAVAPSVTPSVASSGPPSTSPSTARQTPSAGVPALLSSLSQIAVPTGCRFCGGTLPTDRDVNYCPHCGENLKTQRCPACGGEMEATWRFCVTCGRKAG